MLGQHHHLGKCVEHARRRCRELDHHGAVVWGLDRLDGAKTGGEYRARLLVLGKLDGELHIL